MKRYLIGLTAALMALSACEPEPVLPTAYGPAGTNGMGYVDRPLGPKTHEIQVRTTSATSPQTTEEHFRRRARELCSAGIEKQELKHSTLTTQQETQILVGPYPAYMPSKQGELPLVTGTVTCK